jgi:hypothetical protein
LLLQGPGADVGHSVPTRVSRAPSRCAEQSAPLRGSPSARSHAPLHSTSLQTKPTTTRFERLLAQATAAHAHCCVEISTPARAKSSPRHRILRATLTLEELGVAAFERRQLVA